MKNIQFVTPITVLSYDELTQAQRELIDAAREATYKAYAPYSHFSVGSAIRLANGEIVSGSNQENAAYPSGLCAERTAAFWANANHPGQPFEMIAVSARGTDGKPTPNVIPPCGACRQVLLEYEVLADHPVPVLLDGAKEIYLLPSVASLLPVKFDSF